MRNGEPQIYTSLATLRNGYMLTQWARVQMLLVFNTIAIPIILGTEASTAMKLALSGMGFVGHFALFVAAVRSNGWIRYWDRRMAELERLDQEEGNASGTRVRVFDPPEFNSRRRRGITSRRVLAPIGIFFLLLWLFASVRHTFLLIFPF